MHKTMTNSGTSTTSTSGSSSNGQTYRGPFAIMTVLFFMWGFMTVFNDILIPQFKKAFTLNYTEAMLVQLAFFGAYFIGSLVYFIISSIAGDPIAKIGYKNGVVIGLLLAALGSGLFWPGHQPLLPVVSYCLVYCRTGIRHAANRRQSLRDDSWP